jgi:hypothetical protein
MQCPCAILSSVTCLPLKYSPNLSENGKIFEKGGGGKVVLNIKYVLIFATNFFLKTFLIL